MMNVCPGYTFDDLLLIPKFSNISSRTDIDLSLDLGKGVKLDMPIVSANMSNVTGEKMAHSISRMGGLALIHRFMSYEEQGILYSAVKRERPYNIGCSVGVQSHDYKQIDTLVKDVDCKILCVDVAHGAHINCIDMVKHIAKEHPNVLLIAGNVATNDGAIRLAEAGADVIKVGVGPGSLCTTRIETGNGVPQLTALESIYKRSFSSNYKRTFKIIADGGIKNAGDIVKGLCFSDCVMLGNLLAGTDESPGDIITTDRGQFKQYAGSSTHKVNHVEGVVGLVPYKGPVDAIIKRLLEGVRSGLSYQGAKNLEELRIDPQFVSISHAGLVESKPHDIVMK